MDRPGQHPVADQRRNAEQHEGPAARKMKTLAMRLMVMATPPCYTLLRAIVVNF